MSTLLIYMKTYRYLLPVADIRPLWYLAIVEDIRPMLGKEFDVTIELPVVDISSFIRS